jgi:hypothetical protein
MRVTAAARRRRTLLLVSCAVAIAAALTSLIGLGGAGAVSGSLIGQPVFGTPAGRFLGSSPGETAGEAWAVARDGSAVVRYREGEGWTTLPGPLQEGQEIPGLEFLPGALSGRTTYGGGLALAARDEAEQLLIVRDPGGNPHAAPPPGAALEEGESLFGEAAGEVLLAPVEEDGGGTVAYVVPAAESPAREEAVLAFDGTAWAREPICIGFEGGPGCTEPPGSFRVLAIDASDAGNAWLLAKGATPGEGVELFKREGDGPAARWRQRRLGPPGSLGAKFAEATVSPAGQALTVTPAGAWIDTRLDVGEEAADATVYFDLGAGKVTASWCDLGGEICEFPLGSELAAGEGRSFATAPRGDGEPFGSRYITGLSQGAFLALEGTAFQRLSLAGGSAGGAEGAALDEAGEGWLGASPPVHITSNPEPARLVPWPVPFRRPLTAVAPEPGAPVGDLGSEALAVGSEGQVARYLPGQGWTAEALLTGSGARAKPNLRAVAWPEPERAFAVGDGAAMWVWQKATGLWSPDPAAPPNLVRANFTAIAFDPARPSRGYAVGKQGVLLGYGRSWAQEALPSGVDPEANFTSVAFAGEEAIATYKVPFDKNGSPAYEGGVIVNDGSGWKVDPQASEALAGAVPQLVAGLPDGGAVIAAEEGGTGGSVIERQSPDSSWQAVGGDPLGYPAALAAIREGGAVRALVSVSPGQGREDVGTDFEQVFNQPGPGSPPLLTAPYPLPSSGYLVRQTGSGWRDEQHEAYPLPPHEAGQGIYDLPRRPDPVLALLVDPSGAHGWALGGETGTNVRFQGSAVQTAGVLRYGAEAAPPSNTTFSALQGEPGSATFAIGGDAQCAGPCADLGATGIGPDVWLRSAISRAGSILGLRAFVYTGSSVAAGKEGRHLSEEIGTGAFQREEDAYARRLASAGSPPVFAAPAASDLDRSGTLSSFESAFSGFAQPFGAASPPPGIEPREKQGGYYAFDSSGSGGTVRVVVLDYSAATLGGSQTCWLAGQLAAARSAGVPAIVVGQRDLAGQTAEAAADAATVVPVLVGATSAAALGCPDSGPAGSASAYFFAFPEQNRAYQLSAGGRAIPAFGSGTLGYLVPRRPQETDYVGASGFLLASVDVAARNPATDIAPVRVKLVPNIGALALDATDGTLLRRSQPALFEALARRPLAGGECSGNFAPGTCEALRPDPYVPIPSPCRGPRCATGVFPDYTFTSSAPDIADFVATDPGSADPRHLLLVEGKPVLDSHSGLLCAFNAGTTTVTVSTGGLSYSQKVTVLGGSPQRPCGTTPLRNRAATEPEITAPPLGPEANPAPEGGPTPLPPPPPPAPASPPVPAPTPAAHHPVPSPPPAAPPLAPFFAPAPALTPLVPIVPPPPLPVAQPTPPSGTSPVTSAVTEEEKEAAFDLVHHMARLHHPQQRAGAMLAASGSAGPQGVALLVPGLVALAALAIAAGAGGRARRGPAYQHVHQASTTRRSR